MIGDSFLAHSPPHQIMLLASPSRQMMQIILGKSFSQTPSFSAIIHHPTPVVTPAEASNVGIGSDSTGSNRKENHRKEHHRHHYSHIFHALCLTDSIVIKKVVIQFCAILSNEYNLRREEYEALYIRWDGGSWSKVCSRLSIQLPILEFFFHFIPK